MDVCARGRVTVCIEASGKEPVVLVVDPVANREELYKMIVECFVTLHPSTGSG
jgi:hypothetical protein